MQTFVRHTPARDFIRDLPPFRNYCPLTFIIMEGPTDSATVTPAWKAGVLLLNYNPIYLPLTLRQLRFRELVTVS